MLHMLIVLGVVSTTSFTHAAPVENEKRQGCDAFLRQLFGAATQATFPSLAERLNLQSPFALEIFRDGFRRCPVCVPMGHSEGVLDRIPPGQFGQVFLHDLPEFRTTESGPLRQAFEVTLRSLGKGGELILTLTAPTDWALLNAQIAIGRELGLEVTTLQLAEFDMAGAKFVKRH